MVWKRMRKKERLHRRHSVPASRPHRAPGADGRSAGDRSVARRWVAGLLLVAATCLAYAPALFGGFVFDDRLYVVENAALGSLSGLEQIWLAPKALPQYYPLAFTVFWIEHHLWGAAPQGYHATNVVLHIANAILVWMVLRRLQGQGGLLAATVFALHPVHVESVAWVTELKNVMSGMFALLAILAWLRFVDQRSWGRYAVALGLFTCAMLSKTVAVTLPPVFLLLAWWKEPRSWQREVRWVWPFLAVGLGLGLVTAWREHVEQAIAVLPQLSPIDRVLVAGRALAFYVSKLMWPASLAFVYPQWTIDPRSPLAYIFPVAVVVVVVALWRWRDRVGRAPLVAVVFFILQLSPVLGLVNFNFMRLSYVADHFQYLASVGVIALVAGVATWLFARLGPPYRSAGLALAGLMSCILGTLTWRQCLIYRSEETLWLDTVAKNPQSGPAHYYLASERVRQGRLDEAEASYGVALRLQPDSALLHNNHGMFLFQRGKLEEAVAEFSAAVRIAPDWANMHQNLATALVQKGDLDGAIQHFRQALRIQPDSALLHNNLATILAQRGELDEATLHLREAVRYRPDNADMRTGLGILLMRQGKLDDAIHEFGEALRIRPDHSAARQSLRAAEAQVAARHAASN
jgi:protein O-mannosyl-transferase